MPTPDTVTSGAFGATANLKYDPAEEERKRQAAEAARRAAELAQFEKDRAAQAAVNAQPEAPNAAAVPTSPVATPSGLGAKLVAAAQSGAQQSLASPSPQGDSAAYPGVLQRQGGGSGSFRNSTGDVVSVPAYGAADPVADPASSMADAITREAMAGQPTGPDPVAGLPAPEAGVQPQPAPAVAAGNRPFAQKARTDPASGMLPPPAAGPAEQRVALAGLRPAPEQIMGATPGYTPLAPELEAALPAAPEAPEEPVTGRDRTVTPKAPKAPMTAREEAEARTPKGRTGWQKLGIALSIAAETLGAGRQNAGLTAANMKSSSREEAVDKLEAIIQKERDRLQLDNDRLRRQAREDAGDAREDRKLGQKDVELANDYEVAKANAARQQSEVDRKAAWDRVREIGVIANANHKAAMIEDIKAGRKTIPAGGILTEINPITKERVEVFRNEMQTVTTDTSTSTKQAYDKDGKPGPKVVEENTNTRTKGPAGGRATGGGTTNIAPAAPEQIKARRATIKEALRTGKLNGKDVTPQQMQVWVDYLEKTGGQEN